MFSKTIQFVLVATVLWTQSLAHADYRPNILLILTDNTGWGDWGTYGGGELRGAPSPRIDQLAEEGMTLLNFNTEPQCTPSRSALMTGRFAIRSGCAAKIARCQARKIFILRQRRPKGLNVGHM